ncbi:MFS transporter [Solihabitans fulvus]|uniref:MFS transporter n=1 Tax=Solihabitans fulvus TaxID=1892852 RepID=A0A5B2WKE6_9PSEU|nr:MDR family MFS transporter [Solihabitans fulvus]KAA2251384.1 MFS transporter [Solihabitans fulvus]
MSHREILEALSGLLLALLVAILSSTIVSNALPTILADLKGTQTQYTWVITATLLASTATTPIWGKLADLFNKKLLYQISIVIFVLGSALAGLAQNMGELIAARAVQGLGMGGVQALAQVIIGAMVAPRERGRYSGYMGAVMAVATVGGPIIGGLIVDSSLGWRWCFYVCVPLAVVALVVLAKTLHLPTVCRPVKIDYFGAVLIPGGVSLLLFWVSFAGKNFAWVSWSSAVYVGGALLVFALAIFAETRASSPIVPLRLFRNRTMTLAVLGSIGVGTAMFGSSVFLGQYYQLARGYSPTHAGLMTLPMVFGLLVSSTVSGQLISRYGKWKGFLVGGSVSLVAGLGLLGTIDHQTNLVLMGGYLVLLGVGLGLTMQNLVLSVQNGVGLADLGAASSTVTFFRSLGGTMGVSVLGAVLATQVGSKIATGIAALHLPPGARASGGGTLDIKHLPAPIQAIVRAAYGDAMSELFLIAAAIALVTVVAVLFIKEVPLRTSLDSSTEITQTAAGVEPVDQGSSVPVDTDLRIVDNPPPAVDNPLLHVGDHEDAVDSERWRYEKVRAQLSELTLAVQEAGDGLNRQARHLRVGLDQLGEDTVNVARTEADQILARARAEAAEVVREARAEAGHLVSAARMESAMTGRKIAELRQLESKLLRSIAEATEYQQAGRAGYGTRTPVAGN